MRTDMAKVIVERPRLSRPPRGKGSPYPRGRLKTIFERDLEGAPSKLGMGFPHAEKWLNENLAPLRRFVMGKVGRRWDLVRAEISAHVRRTSAVQAHVFEHLGDMVIENVEMVDGRPHMRRWGKLEPIAGRRHKAASALRRRSRSRSRALVAGCASVRSGSCERSTGAGCTSRSRRSGPRRRWTASTTSCSGSAFRPPVTSTTAERSTSSSVDRTPSPSRSASRRELALIEKRFRSARGS